MSVGDGTANWREDTRFAGSTARREPGLIGRTLRLKRGRIGAGLVGIVVLLATLGPFLAPHSPYDFVGAPYQAAGGPLWLGADNVGRDVLSRLLSGGWTVLWMSLSATALSMTCGTLLGLTAGHAGRGIDTAIMRSLDVVLAFPERILVLMCVSILGASNPLLVLATALVFIPTISRAARAATLDVVRNEYVEYAEALGMSRWRLITREILPNIATPLLVEAGFRLTWSIGLITGISFLGFGSQPPIPDWGLMINESRDGLLFQPWAVAAPVLCIAVFVIGANLFADAMSRAAGRTAS